MKKIIAISALLISSFGFSQFSTSILDYNNASAIVTDGGMLFNDQSTNTAGYEIPANSGNTAIYSAAFWFDFE